MDREIDARVKGIKYFFLIEVVLLVLNYFFSDKTVIRKELDIVNIVLVLFVALLLAFILGQIYGYIFLNILDSLVFDRYYSVSNLKEMAIKKISVGHCSCIL